MNLFRSKSLNWALLALIGAVMVTEFNNCGEYAQPASYLSASSLTCDNNHCITPTVSNLSIQANLGGGSDFKVPANLAEWNIGGDCNEGGYNYNTIVWELYLNGAKVRDSNMTGMISASPSMTVNSQCVNGRFEIYVNMSAITQDPVNRTGLLSGSGATRAAYDLYIQIYGKDSANGVPQPNDLTGRTHVSLLAI
jgi:hypothetical protein